MVAIGSVFISFGQSEPKIAHGGHVFVEPRRKEDFFSIEDLIDIISAKFDS